MIICIELILFEQSSSLVDILKFPTAPLFPSSVTYKIKTWSEGKSRTIKPKQVDTFIEKLRDRPFNEVEIKYEMNDQRLDLPYSIHNAYAFLRCSPTSQAWSDPSEWPSLPVNRFGLVDYRLMRARREVFEEQKLVPYPTIFELYLEAQISLSDFKATPGSLNKFLEIFVLSIPDSCKTLINTGSVRFEEDRYEGVIFLTSTRMRFGAKMDDMIQLVSKFDDPHPILIGPMDTCMKLKKICPSATTQYIEPHVNELGVILIPFKAVEELLDKGLKDIFA